MTKRSIAAAVSERASAAVMPTNPPWVCTWITVMKYDVCTSPRPQAGRNGAGSGISRMREVTDVIVVGLANSMMIFVGTQRHSANSAREASLARPLLMQGLARPRAAA